MTLPTNLSAEAYLPRSARSELDLALPIGQGAPKKQAKLVQERLCLAGFNVRVDADFGPATQQQIENFQKKAGLKTSGQYGSDEHEILSTPFVKALAPTNVGGQDMGNKIVALARQHIRQKPIEIGGDNRGPWVRLYMDGQDGEEWKWCAGFCFFVILQACEAVESEAPMKKTFTVDTIVERAKASGQFCAESELRSKAAKARIVPGSLFLVRASRTHWSHVGIVAESSEASFVSCEGNTNDDGSSNGFEAVERVRGYIGKDFVIW